MWRVTGSAGNSDPAGRPLEDQLVLPSKEMEDMRDQGMSYRAIARRFRLSTKTVKRLFRNLDDGSETEQVDKDE